MDTMEEVVLQYGFESTEEFYLLVSNVDISTPIKFAKFRKWQFMDGTKEGLLKITSDESARITISMDTINHKNDEK